MIFEAKIDNILDSILLITAKKSIRIDRALKRKNLPLEQIQNRMSLQISEKTKKLKADFTINNNGNMDQLHKKLEQYYHSLSIWFFHREYGFCDKLKFRYLSSYDISLSIQVGNLIPSSSFTNSISAIIRPLLIYVKTSISHVCWSISI